MIATRVDPYRTCTRSYGCFSDLPDFAGSCHNGVLWQRRNTLRRPENLGIRKKEKYERGTRSYIMSHIRGKDTSIEMMVRSFLFSKGLRFRKNDKRYRGIPTWCCRNTVRWCSSTAVSGICMKIARKPHAYRNRMWNSGVRNCCATTNETPGSIPNLKRWAGK